MCWNNLTYAVRCGRVSPAGICTEQHRRSSRLWLNLNLTDLAESCRRLTLITDRRMNVLRPLF